MIGRLLRTDNPSEKVQIDDNEIYIPALLPPHYRIIFLNSLEHAFQFLQILNVHKIVWIYELAPRPSWFISVTVFPMKSDSRTILTQTFPDFLIICSLPLSDFLRCVCLSDWCPVHAPVLQQESHLFLAFLPPPWYFTSCGFKNECHYSHKLGLWISLEQGTDFYGDICWSLRTNCPLADQKLEVQYLACGMNYHWPDFDTGSFL